LRHKFSAKQRSKQEVLSNKQYLGTEMAWNEKYSVIIPIKVPKIFHFGSQIFKFSLFGAEFVPQIVPDFYYPFHHFLAQFDL
jgi:hypothetical protein